MANTRISDLTASASNLASTDLAPVVQTVGVGPVKMTGLQLAGGLLGSTTFNGSTVTTSQPVLNLTQTWNAGAVTFTGLKFNVTNTASSSSSNLIDLQVNTNSAFAVQNIGGGAPIIGLNVANGSGFYGTLLSSGSSQVAYFGATSTAGYTFALSGSYYLGFYAPGSISVSSTPDLRLTRAAAATLQLGAGDAAAPVAQTLQVQSVVAGTSNTAGANFTINGSKGTGTGAGGSIIFQVAPAGSSGTAQNAYATALTINSARNLEVGGSSIQFGSAGSGTRLLTGAKALIIDSGNTNDFGSVTASSYILNSDVILARDAANTLALRNGTNAQRFNVYNTYTSSTNYETFKVDWITTANTCLIGTEKGSGGGTARSLALQTDGTTRWVVASDGSRLRAPVGSGDASVGHLESNNDLYLGASAGGTLGLRGFGDTIILIDAGNSYSDKVFSVRNNSSAFGSATTILTARENGSVIIGNLSSALATTATDGFLYVPTCAGTPTGTPTTQTGTAPIVVDTTNNKLYFYSGGAWRDAGP